MFLSLENNQEHVQEILEFTHNSYTSWKTDIIQKIYLSLVSVGKLNLERKTELKSMLLNWESTTLQEISPQHHQFLLGCFNSLGSILNSRNLSDPVPYQKVILDIVESLGEKADHAWDLLHECILQKLKFDNYTKDELEPVTVPMIEDLMIEDSMIQEPLIDDTNFDNAKMDEQDPSMKLPSYKFRPLPGPFIDVEGSNSPG